VDFTGRDTGPNERTFRQLGVGARIRGRAGREVPHQPARLLPKIPYGEPGENRGAATSCKQELAEGGRLRKSAIQPKEARRKRAGCQKISAKLAKGSRRQQGRQAGGCRSKGREPGPGTQRAQELAQAGQSAEF